MKLKRNDFRELAKLRARDAQVLLEGGRRAGAYYLAGYAVECGLKACIAKSTQRFEFPDLERVRSSYTHDLERLIEVAGLKEVLTDAWRQRPQLAANWHIVKQWSERSRYGTRTKEQARNLIRAIADRHESFLQWLELYW